MKLPALSMKQPFILWDLLFFGILVIFSLFLISFYFGASTLDTHYPDWMVHAFRIKELKEHGLASWTHTWANGISLWRSYQFIPHYLTVLLVNSLHVSITRAMVIMTILCFIFLRISIYVVLRLLHFPPITAFVCSLLSFDIAQYWSGVSDYSLMVGFTFMPIIIFLWVKYFQGKLQNLYPYIAGIAFYIHPLLGMSGIILWIIGVIFSERRIMSWSILAQFLIFMIASSLFWFPLIFKTSYSYTNPVFGEKFWITNIVSPYKYYGLSIFIIIAIGMCSLRVFMPIEKTYRWTKVLYVYVLGYFILTVITLSIQLPGFIAGLQYVRGITLFGIAALFVFASVVEKLRLIRSTAIKGICLFFLSLVMVEGMWFASDSSPAGARDFLEPVTAYQQKFKDRDLSDGRIWSSEIGESSFYAPFDIRLPYSYMGHLEQNQVAPRLSSLVLYQPYVDKVPLSNINRINDYFKLAGVKYIFFNESSPFTTSILNTNKQIYKDLGMIKSDKKIYHAFQTPWQTLDAVAIDPRYEKDIAAFPQAIQLSEINDQITLDEKVKKLTTVLSKPENIPLRIEYPKNDTLQIVIPRDVHANSIYVNETYDTGWHGYFDKERIALSPAGPNFMQLKIPQMHKEGTIILTHQWPVSFYISLFLICLLPIELFIVALLGRFQTRKSFSIAHL